MELLYVPPVLKLTRAERQYSEILPGYVDIFVQEALGEKLVRPVKDGRVSRQAPSVDQHLQKRRSRNYGDLKACRSEGKQTEQGRPFA
jgi:hypothetical protein